jgi:radical SAM protein with 4Fe4S-binding SPASM domain
MRHSAAFFRQDGNVYACCMNEAPLGNLRDSTLDEIWHGEKINAIREQLAKGRLGDGCNVCAKFLIADGDSTYAPMRYFDHLSPPTDDWPNYLDFSMSNSCNLQCVMCGGMASSAIRHHREHKPPLPHPYTDELLHGMRDYFAHAATLRFAGGEPFLVREYYTIWDIVIELGLPDQYCWLTTNATQYHRRVECVLDHLRMGIQVSMDGATRETVESIRIGLDYDRFMTNAWRFREYTRERGLFYGLSMCCMTQNWFEFGKLRLLADEWDCELNVIFVVAPTKCSLLMQPIEKTREVLEGMERETLTLEHQLGRNRDVWFSALRKVRSRAMAIGV